MKKKYWNLIIYGLVVLAIYGLVNLVGCDESGAEDDLLASYQGHISSAQTLVGGHAGGSADADRRYDSEMRGHLAEMTEIRQQMLDQCTALDTCSSGGGWSGEMAGDHMGKGRMLVADEMSTMQQREATMNNALDDFEEHCLGQTSQSNDINANVCREQHFEHMRQILDAQYEFCDQMMQSHQTGNDQDGHMGNHMHGGMM